MIRKSLLSAAIVLASANVCSTAFANFVVPPQSNWPFFVTAGVGGSWSRKAEVTVDPLEYDPAIQGYDSDLDSSELYTAGFGYRFSNAFSLSVDVTRRPSFSYSKFQEPLPGSSTAIGALGIKTRHFDFANTSIMADLTLYGSGLWPEFLNWNLGNCVFVEPFVGVGVGVAYNHISDFHSVTAAGVIVGDHTDYEVHTIENEKTFREFAWEARVGLRLNLGEHVSFDAGYRYFDGGKFHSNSYDYALAGAEPFTNVPWDMKFRAHEGYVNMNYMWA